MKSASEQIHKNVFDAQLDQFRKEFELDVKAEAEASETLRGKFQHGFAVRSIKKRSGDHNLIMKDEDEAMMDDMIKTVTTSSKASLNSKVVERESSSTSFSTCNNKTTCRRSFFPQRSCCAVEPWLSEYEVTFDAGPIGLELQGGWLGVPASNLAVIGFKKLHTGNDGPAKRLAEFRPCLHVASCFRLVTYITLFLTCVDVVSLAKETFLLQLTDRAAKE